MFRGTQDFRKPANEGIEEDSVLVDVWMDAQRRGGEHNAPPP